MKKSKKIESSSLNSQDQYKKTINELRERLENQKVKADELVQKEKSSSQMEIEDLKKKYF